MLKITKLVMCEENSYCPFRRKTEHQDKSSAQNNAGKGRISKVNAGWLS